MTADVAAQPKDFRATATATIIGFDGSLTASGLARWRDGLWHFETIRTSPDDPATPSIEHRWARIIGHLRPHLGEPQRVLVVAESVFSNANHGQASADVVMTHGVIRYRLHQLGVPVALVQTQHLKQYATGKGNAKKPAMVAAAADQLGVRLSDHNQADAAWLAAMGVHRYGQPLYPATPLQQVVISAVRWPQWSLETPTEGTTQ